jgi:hypothetical protein
MILIITPVTYSHVIETADSAGTRVCSLDSLNVAVKPIRWLSDLTR